MNITDKQELKDLIKEGTIDALQSDQGRRVIKEGTIEALRSDEGKEAMLDVFVDAFHDVVVPVIEHLHSDHERRIQKIEDKLGVTN